MEKLCSWRFSRIVEASAWKRLLLYNNWWIPLGFCVIAGCIALFIKTENDAILLWYFCGLCLFLGICDILKIVLGADKCYKLKLQSQVCHIYVYRRNDSDQEDIFILQDNTETYVKVKEMPWGESGYRYCHWSEFSSFMFCPSNGNVWFYLSPISDEPQVLGRKIHYGIGDTIFLNSIDNNGKSNLCILHELGVRHIKASRFVIAEAYVPPKARKKMKCEIDAHFVPIEVVPENYLIVEDNEKYQVWGISSDWTNKPYCRKISVPVIIYQDMNDRVILIEKEDTYQPLCRKVAATRWVNDVIAELSDLYDGTGHIGGIVWQLDEDTMQLIKLYEGVYHAIGFADGSIIGDNWEYTPKEGFEYE